jgi:hypothetical protein
MTIKNLTLNIHDFGVPSDDFANNAKLSSFFKQTSASITDAGVLFAMSMEANDYPIYAIMYHNEYQWYHFLTEDKFNQVQNEETAAMYHHVSRFMFNEASKNDHSASIEWIMHNRLDQFNVHPYPVMGPMKGEFHAISNST